MGAYEKITVELPKKMAARLRARVSAGEFASESDAIIEALLALDTPPPSETEIDAWLRGPVAQACDEVRAGTATLLTLDKVRDRLSLKRA